MIVTPEQVSDVFFWGGGEGVRRRGESHSNKAVNVATDY